MKTSKTKELRTRKDLYLLTKEEMGLFRGGDNNEASDTDTKDEIMQK
jgi:hypothetical protein